MLNKKNTKTIVLAFSACYGAFPCDLLQRPIPEEFCHYIRIPDVTQVRLLNSSSEIANKSMGEGTVIDVAIFNLYKSVPNHQIKSFGLCLLKLFQVYYQDKFREYVGGKCYFRRAQYISEVELSYDLLLQYLENNKIPHNKHLIRAIKIQEQTCWKRAQDIEDIMGNHVEVGPTALQGMDGEGETGGEVGDGGSPSAGVETTGGEGGGGGNVEVDSTASQGMDGEGETQQNRESEVDELVFQQDIGEVLVSGLRPQLSHELEEDPELVHEDDDVGVGVVKYSQEAFDNLKEKKKKIILTKLKELTHLLTASDSTLSAYKTYKPLYQSTFDEFRGKITFQTYPALCQSLRDSDLIKDKGSIDTIESFFRSFEQIFQKTSIFKTELNSPATFNAFQSQISEICNSARSICSAGWSDELETKLKEAAEDETISLLHPFINAHIEEVEYATILTYIKQALQKTFTIDLQIVITVDDALEVEQKAKIHRLFESTIKDTQDACIKIIDQTISQKQNAKQSELAPIVTSMSAIDQLLQKIADLLRNDDEWNNE